jgi:hypothetical protein
MGSILRSVLAVVAGFVLASSVMMAVESVNGRFLYPELGKAAQGVIDREAMRALMAGAPVGAFLVVLFGWALGGFAGGWLAARIAKGSPKVHAFILGALLTAAGISNNLMLPPPFWFWCISLVVLIPAAYAGSLLAPARTT